MAKRIALTDYIEIDNVTFNVSDVRSVAFTSEDAQIDAGGFNADGETTILPGVRTKSVTLEFYTNRASGAMHQILYPLHRDRSSFDFSWRADQNAGASATNPELRGTVKLPTWNEGATFGDVEVTSLTFVSQADNGLEFYAT
jgi:hypothetical protein